MKVVLVSEHQLLQNLLHIALERRAGVEIVGEFLEGRSALKSLAELTEDRQPDLVILGLQLPDMDGVALTEQLRQQAPKVRVLAVTGQAESKQLIPFLLAGGHGYLSQYPSDEEFYCAIEDVSSGRIYLNPTGNAVLEETCHQLSALRDLVIHREVVKEETQPSAYLHRHLSEREKQVLHLYVNGYSSSEIGGILYMSVNTVETHKKRIKEKLNLTRKADLTAYAKQNGLFEDWD
ncbi:MAG: response regulator transcription factor [Lachnospiraceae bacterium]|nr:response regulator transcription factor [Lachnospiraceae bacterium]